MQVKAQGWLNMATNTTPLSDSFVVSCCQPYLNTTSQTMELRERILLRDIRSAPQHGPSLTMSFDAAGSWLSSLHASLAMHRLFDDGENFLLDSFKHFDLNGLSEAFTNNLRDDFRDNVKRQFDSGYSVNTTHIHFHEQFEPSKRLSRPGFVGTLLGAGIAVGGCEKLASHAATLWIPLEAALATSLAGAVLLLGVQYSLYRSRKREYILSSFSQSVCKAVYQLCQTQWAETVSKINPALARQIIGQRTLVKKRPLEYAQEGALDAYAQQEG